MEEHPLESWYGVEGLITDHVEEKFGIGTESYLREAEQMHHHMKEEMPRRYGLA